MGFAGGRGSGRARRVPSLWAECRQIKSLSLGLRIRSRDAGWGSRGLAGSCRAFGSREPGMPEGREPGRKGWPQVTPAVGRSGGSPGGHRPGHNPPAGPAARGALGGDIAPHLAVPSAATLQARGRARATCPLVPNSPSFLLDISVSACAFLCRGLVAALASPSLPLPESSRQSSGWHAAWFPGGICATWWH